MIKIYGIPYIRKLESEKEINDRVCFLKKINVLDEIDGKPLFEIDERIYVNSQVNSIFENATNVFKSKRIDSDEFCEDKFIIIGGGGYECRCLGRIND